MVRYCDGLQEVIFFLSMDPRGTGDVRGVFGGPRGTSLPGGLDIIYPIFVASSAAIAIGDTSSSCACSSRSLCGELAIALTLSVFSKGVFVDLQTACVKVLRSRIPCVVPLARSLLRPSRPGTPVRRGGLVGTHGRLL